MKQLLNANGVQVGVASEFIKTDSGWVGDGIVYPLSVVGEGCQVEDYVQPPPVIEQPVPDAVRNAQARLALRKAGLLERVLAEIEAMEEPHRTDAKIVWEYEQNIRRDNPLVLSLGALLGLNSKQLDDLFILATTL